MARAPLTIGKFLIIFICWWLIWAFLHTILLMGFGLSLGVSVTDSLVSNTLVALSCGFVSNNMQYYLPKRERYWYILFVSLALSILILLACKGILVPLLGAQTRETAAFARGNLGDITYGTFFNRSWGVRFDIFFLQIGCMTILSVLYYSSEEEQQQLQRKADAEKLAKEAELFKLRQQLSPHFLFNSLNSISALIGSQPEQARKMIQLLSDFLRGNLRKEEQQWVLLSEELQNLQLYLEIEKVRFGHRLSTHIDYEDNCLSMKLPPMLLQPIVENAIKFGLYDTTDDVCIGIRAWIEGGYALVAVNNPFDPETSRPKKGTGFGLSYIQRRLYLLFARSDLLETRVEQDRFITTVKIPQ